MRFRVEAPWCSCTAQKCEDAIRIAIQLTAVNTINFLTNPHIQPKPMGAPQQ